MERGGDEEEASSPQGAHSEPRALIRRVVDGERFTRQTRLEVFKDLSF